MLLSRPFQVFVGLAIIGTAWAIHRIDNGGPTLPERDIRPAAALIVPAGAETATFAGGCFWGVEETFRAVPGVLDTRAGYTGGSLAHPTYEQIHRRDTGHVEAVEVAFDPRRVSYDRLLAVFFASHNPTLPTAQGQKIGKQYRSFVFVHTKAQAEAARRAIRALSASHHYPGSSAPIVTQVQPAQTFWPAERYHQRYYAQRGASNACAL